MTSQVKIGLPENFHLEHDSETNILSIFKKGSKDSGLSVDFEKSINEFRRQKISPRTDLLARALGFKKGMKIADLTVGLAQDSLKLAYFGAEVTGVEAQPWIFALLKNAQERANDEEAVRRLNIVVGSSIEWIDRLLPAHDVFYLDPMFNHKRRALPKKGMQYLAEIAHDTEDGDWLSLMEKITKTKKRLVVKRPPNAEPLCGVEPLRSIEGKMIRFDIY